MNNTTEEKLVSAEEIKAAALRIFTHDEIQNLSRIPFRGFLILIEKRLRKDGPPPTDDELDGLRELAFEHLWHSAFDGLRPHRAAGMDNDTTGLSTSVDHSKSELPSC
jgi:hypothetical protein